LQNYTIESKNQVRFRGNTSTWVVSIQQHRHQALIDCSPPPSRKSASDKTDFAILPLQPPVTPQYLFIQQEIVIEKVSMPPSWSHTFPLDCSAWMMPLQPQK
jgi:hypothetical protein